MAPPAAPTTAPTVATLAKLFNLTPGRVYQLAQAGIIPRPERGKCALIGSVQGYVKYLQARAEGRGVEGQDVRTERARLTRAQARKAELECGALERSLLPFDEVVQAWQQLVAAFRARCLAMPSKLAPPLATINESREIQAALTAAVREALQELSRFDLPRDRPGRPRGEATAGSNGKSRGNHGAHGQRQSTRGTGRAPLLEVEFPRPFGYPSPYGASKRPVSGPRPESCGIFLPLCRACG